MLKVANSTCNRNSTNSLTDSLGGMEEFDRGQNPVVEPRDPDSTENCVSSMFTSIDKKLVETFIGLQQSQLWQVPDGKGIDQELIGFVGREWNRGILFYNPYFKEASRSAFSSMPHTTEGRIRRALRRLQVELSNQGKAALHDYQILGGDVDIVRTLQPDPATYAVGAFWSMLGQAGDVFSYLGALYAMNLVTTWVSEFLSDKMMQRDLATDSLALPLMWSTNSRRRSLVARAIVHRMAMKHPISWELIILGAERLLQVYPVPICNEIEQRADRLYGGFA